MSLIVPITPMPDESLAGLVARAAGANVYPRASDVVSQLTTRHLRAEALGLHVDLAANLAALLGTSADRLHPLFTPALGRQLISFFGVPMRQIYRETRARRVSPRALKQAPYIRAIWSIVPFNFDPETRERLIAQCPVCHRTLGFASTWGVKHCEHCLGDDEFGLPVSQVDLRDFPQPLVEVEDEDALRFVIDLVDPKVKTLERYTLPAFQDLSRAELFDTVVSIAVAVSCNQSGSGGVPPVDIPRQQIHKLEASALADAGRAMLSWPNGFIDLCARAQADANSREGSHGLRKEFGILPNVARDPLVPRTARDAVSDALNQAFANLKPQAGIARKSPTARAVGRYVRFNQILELTPVSQKIVDRMRDHPEIKTIRDADTFMSPILFETEDVAGVLTEYLDLMSEDKLGWALGLPPDGVRDLTAFMNIPTTGAAQIARDLDLGEGPYYPKHTAEEIIDILRTGIELRKPPKGYVSFMDVMLMFPAGRRPWRPVLEAILFEKVEAVYRRRSSKGLLGGIWVKGIDAIRDDILFDHQKACHHGIEAVSIGAANLMLGISQYPAVVACFEAGLLDKNSDGQVRYDSILAFADRYIFSNEAGVRSRNSGHTIRAWLDNKGIKPAHDFGIKGGLIYDRERVEPVLEMRADR